MVVAVVVELLPLPLLVARFPCCTEAESEQVTVDFDKVSGRCRTRLRDVFESRWVWAEVSKEIRPLKRTRENAYLFFVFCCIHACVCV